MEFKTILSFTITVTKIDGSIFESRNIQYLDFSCDSISNFADLIYIEKYNYMYVDLKRFDGIY